MKTRWLILGVLGLGATATTLSIGPKRTLNAVKSVAENIGYEAKHFFEDERFSIRIETDEDNITDKYISVDGKAFTVNYMIHLPGEEIEYFKVTVDDDLKGRGEVKDLGDKIQVIFQTTFGNTKREFKKPFAELNLFYPSSFTTLGLEEGLHTVKLWMKDRNGDEFTDEAYLRIK